MKYRVTGFEWVHWRNLEVHPEAKVPIAEEDREALEKSVKDDGMIQPLLVIPRKETRQDGAAPKKAKGKDKGEGEARCVHCDDEGFCTNKDMQGGGFHCFHCEDFKARGDDAGKKNAGGPPAPRRFWIVDGANRFAAHQKGDADVLPCVVVELEEGASVRDLALECASVGRSRSAGQRIMVYLERHKAEVLQAAEKGREATQFGSVRSRDRTEEIRDFSSRGIAQTLGVSDKDTLLAIDLLKSHERREGVSSVVGGLREEGRKLEEGDPELKAIDEAWAGVLAGRTPIRRWKAAVGGKRTTKDVQRAAVSWYDVGKKGLVSLRGVGEHWDELPMEDRMELLQLAREVAAELPREVREVFAGAVR